MRKVVLLAFGALSLVTCDKPAETLQASRYLYVWMGDRDEQQSDFMAVVDVKPGSASFGKVLSSEPVGMTGSMPHHLEYQLPHRGELLFGNAHHHETILAWDWSDVLHPKVAHMIQPPAPYRFPHDFARLPNRNLLVGFMRSEGPSPVKGETDDPGAAGGIGEMTPDGKFLRTASADDSSQPWPVRPYALLPLPDIDRLVTTSALMLESSSADVVQIWRLADLKLLHTIETPPALLPSGEPLRTLNSSGTPVATGQGLPFEPRLLSDGSVFLNAFGCGLYRLTDIASDTPKLTNVYTIETPPDQFLGGCGVPVIVGKFWLMPVKSLSAVINFDISDPEHPKEVSRLIAPMPFGAHWLAKDPASNRLTLGQDVGHETRMLMLTIEPGTGKLAWDESLRAGDGSLGLSFDHDDWPHGNTGPANGHAALFVP